MGIEEDSTDIGSAMSSDADMPCSSSCTDEESATGEDTNERRCLMKQKFRLKNLRLTKREAKFRGTPLEPIMGTPAGMSEHPPCFFADEDVHTTECSETD